MKECDGRRDYTIISLGDSESIWKKPYWLKVLPEKSYRKYILKKLPVQLQPIEYMNEQGVNMILPIAKEEIENFDKEYLTSLVVSLIQKYEIRSAYISKELRKYIDYTSKKSKWLIKYMLFPQIYREAMERYHLSKKDVRVVLFDSGNSKMEYLLEIILPDLNHLTIVTERPEYFDTFVETIYENTGLMVELLTMPVSDPICGNLIIDTNKKYYKSYNYFEKNAIIIDLDNSVTKQQYLYNRRNDLKVIYDVEVTAKGEEVDMELLTVILCNKNWNIEKFTYIDNYRCSANYIQNMAELYNIRLESLKIR